MTGSSPVAAVVGAGSVGGNLARRLTDLGDRVVLAARDPASDSARRLAGDVPGLVVTSLAEAGATADLVVLAVPAASAAEAASGVLAGHQAGRQLVIVDATNDVSGTDRSPYDRVSETAAGRDGVEVVKAFNTIGAEAILRPVIDGRPAFLPIAGPPAGAEVTRALAEAIGFGALVIGGPDAVHHLEAHARLWIHLAFRSGLGRDFGFAVIERSGR